MVAIVVFKMLDDTFDVQHRIGLKTDEQIIELCKKDPASFLENADWRVIRKPKIQFDDDKEDED